MWCNLINSISCGKISMEQQWSVVVVTTSSVQCGHLSQNQPNLVELSSRRTRFFFLLCLFRAWQYWNFLFLFFDYKNNFQINGKLFEYKLFLQYCKRRKYFMDSDKNFFLIFNQSNYIKSNVLRSWVLFDLYHIPLYHISL